MAVKLLAKVVCQHMLEVPLVYTKNKGKQNPNHFA